MVDILFEDDELVVLSKPSGMVTNRSDSSRGNSLQDLMAMYLNFDNHCKDVSQIHREFVLRNGMVHRLDKETSGVMLWAKTASTMLALMKQFKAREVRKTYMALVHGRVEPHEGFVGVPIARDTEYRGRFAVDPFGKGAFTSYLVINRYIKEPDRESSLKSIQQLSLVQLRPKTGRTHQIRVHMKHIGYPLVGDSLYLSKKTQKSDSGWCKRLFLHALSIGFTHPISGERLIFRDELDEELNSALAQLQKK